MVSPEDKKAAIFIAIFFLIAIFIELYTTDYTDCIYVQTVANTYEVNYHKRMKKTKDNVEFDNAVCYDMTNLFDNSLKKEGDRDTNRLKKEECEKFLAENNISSDKSIRKIIDICSNFNYDFSTMKVFVSDGKYYFMNKPTLDSHSPYDLYMYDYEKDKLHILYRFENEEILKVMVKRNTK